MISQFYGRHSLSIPKKEEQNHQEDDIINSFYQERQQRSNPNAKQHSLLRKNISYFHQENSKTEKNVEALIQNSLNSTSPSPNLANSHLSRPPSIPKPSHSSLHTSNSIPKSQIPPKSTPLHEASINNISELQSNFSSVRMEKHESEDDEYRTRLKSQLSKRINIKHYLTELSEQNKENAVIPQIHGSLSLKYNYDAKIPHRQDHPIAINEVSRISYSNSRESRVTSEPKDNKSINESRVGLQIKPHGTQGINQSRAINESRHSINSLLHETQNAFQFSRNEITDRTQNNHKLPQEPRYSLPTLGDSNNRSSSSEKKTEKPQPHLNILRDEQLSDLQQNSHPIRQSSQNITLSRHSIPTASRNNMKYFQPQLHAEYKRKIEDLQRQLQEQKAQHKREDKFIQSIFKMRRTMDSTQEDCSLKELWRWIKHLPQRK